MKKKSVTSLLVPALLFPVSAMANWLTLTTENLPSTLVVGHTYSGIVFKIKNTSKSPLSVNVNGIQSPRGFSIAGYIGQCAKALAPGAACTVIESGVYHTDSTQQGQARWSFRFNDGVESYSQDIVRKIATTGVIGMLTKAVPTNVEKEQKYPIEYTFKSIGSAAKNIAVIKPTRQGLFLTNHCASVLAPNMTCTVSGDYIPPASALKQTISLPVKLQYNDGETVALTSHATVDDIVINGEISKPLPPTIIQGVPVEFEYTFSNVSNGDATGVYITPPLVGGMRYSDNCPRGSMRAHSLCTVKIRYTPSASMVGQTVKFPVRLTYNEGAAIELISMAKVVNR